MFKKYCIGLALLTTGLSAQAQLVQLTPGGEAYAGISLGGTNFNDTVSINNTSGTTPTLGQLGFIGGLFVGYDFPLRGPVNTGLELFGNGTTATSSLTDAATGLKISVKYQNNYGVRILPGYRLSPDTVAHFFGGIYARTF